MRSLLFSNNKIIFILWGWGSREKRFCKEELGNTCSISGYKNFTHVQRLVWVLLGIGPFFFFVIFYYYLMANQSSTVLLFVRMCYFLFYFFFL